MIESGMRQTFNRCPFLIKISASNKRLPTKNFQIFVLLAEKLDLSVLSSWKKKKKGTKLNHEWMITESKPEDKKRRRNFEEESLKQFSDLILSWERLTFPRIPLTVLLETCKFPKCEENFNTTSFKSQTCLARTMMVNGAYESWGRERGWIVAEAEREDRWRKRRWARAAIHDLSNYPECRHNLSHDACPPPLLPLLPLKLWTRAKGEGENSAESGEKDFQKGRRNHLFVPSYVSSFLREKIILIISIEFLFSSRFSSDFSIERYKREKVHTRE